MNLPPFPQAAAQLPIGNILPQGSFEISGAVVPYNRLILAGITLAVAGGLAATFRYTRFGLATRAAAENEEGALLTGHSPDRLAAINWALAAVLAGVSVILIASVTKQLDPLGTSLLVVPALAAMLLGGLRSFMLTAFAGLAIGMLQSVILNYSARSGWIPSWIPKSGINQALPFILIIIALTVRGEKLPGRSVILESNMPRSPRPEHVLLTALGSFALVTIALLTLDSQWRLAIVVTMIAALIALSSVVLTGYVGQISLAQLAFAGVAGFATAKLTVAGGIPFPWGPLLAVAITTALGILVGLPAVRVRGMTLAVVTIGAALAIQELVFKSEGLGGLGRQRLSPPTLFGVELGFFATGSDNFRPAYGIFVLVILVFTFVGVANLRRSPTGLRWLAVRANERAAAASGINVTAAKLSAFAISSMIAGIGGVLLAYRGVLAPESFTVFGALALLALTYLGGIASISGAVVAGLLFSGGVLTQLSGGTSGAQSDLAFAISGIALVAVAILYPDGISGALRAGAARLAALRPASSNGETPDGGSGDGPERETSRDEPSDEKARPEQDLRIRPAAGDFDTNSTPLLDVTELSVIYGGLRALDRVSLSVPEGSVVGLIGPNGAGKTTCIDALGGFTTAATGRVVLAGQDISGWPPYRRARDGLVRTFQAVELFDDLTVRENLLVTATRGEWWSPVLNAFWSGRSRHVDVDWALDAVGLDGVADRYPNELAHGRRRLAGIARALASRPRLVLLDEPAAGLDAAESEVLAEQIRSLPYLGISVLLVDHDMSVVHSTCEQIHVLDFGRLIGSGSPEEVLNDPVVIDAYLGEEQKQ